MMIVINFLGVDFVIFLDLKKNVTSYTVFQCWNKERRITDVILVVSVATIDKFDDMIWYRITEEFELVNINCMSPYRFGQCTVALTVTKDDYIHNIFCIFLHRVG